jgi:hypothetical protein
MDSLEATAAPPKRTRRPRLFALFGGCAVLLAAVLFTAVFSRSPAPNVTWLTPAEKARLTRPGLFVRLESKLPWLTKPFQRWYRPDQRMFTASFEVYRLSELAEQLAGLGPPETSDTNGACAWILPPLEAENFRQRLKGIPGAWTESSSTTGFQSIQLAQAALLQPGQPFTLAFHSGLTAEMMLRPAGNSIRLVMSVSDKRVPPSSYIAAGLSGPSVNCQALLPSTYSLLIKDTHSRDDGRHSRWFLVGPRIWDTTTGKPIQPPPASWGANLLPPSPVSAGHDR